MDHYERHLLGWHRGLVHGPWFIEQALQCVEGPVCLLPSYYSICPDPCLSSTDCEIEMLRELYTEMERIVGVATMTVQIIKLPRGLVEVLGDMVRT